MRKCPRCWWETPRQYSSKESHFVWGKRYPLRLSHADTAAAVTLSPRTLHLQVRPGTDTAGHDAVLQAWYRQQKTPECLEYILVHELLHDDWLY
jgi:predicted metal-dependent hydrolase